MQWSLEQLLLWNYYSCTVEVGNTDPWLQWLNERSVLRQVDEARAERSERVCQGSEIVLEIKKSKDGRGVVARNQKEYISQTTRG